MSDPKEVYFRVGPKIWVDAAEKGWDDPTLKVVFYILTCQHRITEGLYRLPEAYIVADCKFKPAKVRQILNVLEADGFIERDGDYVLIVHALEWQAPKAQSNATHAARKVQEFPTRLLSRLLALSHIHSSLLVDALLTAKPDLKPVQRGEL